MVLHLHRKKTSSSAGAEEFSWYCWSWRKVVNLLVLWSGECSPYHSFYLVGKYRCSLYCVAYRSNGLILLLAGKKCRFFVSILRGGSSSVSFWTRSATFFTSWIHHRVSILLEEAMCSNLMDNDFWMKELEIKTYVHSWILNLGQRGHYWPTSTDGNLSPFS